MGRKSKLTPEQVKDIRESTEQLKVIADRNKVTIQYVSAIRRDPNLCRFVEK